MKLFNIILLGISFLVSSCNSGTNTNALNHNLDLNVKHKMLNKINTRHAQVQSTLTTITSGDGMQYELVYDQSAKSLYIYTIENDSIKRLRIASDLNYRPLFGTFVTDTMTNLWRITEIDFDGLTINYATDPMGIKIKRIITQAVTLGNGERIIGVYSFLNGKVFIFTNKGVYKLTPQTPLPAILIWEVQDTTHEEIVNGDIYQDGTDSQINFVVNNSNTGSTTIHSSRDQGETWVEFTEQSPSCRGNHVYQFDSSSMITYEDDDTSGYTQIGLLNFINGQATCTSITTPTFYNISGMAISNEESTIPTIIAVTDNGEVLRSIDKGNSWISLANNLGFIADSIDYINGQFHAGGISGTKTIIKTSEDGVFWTDTNIPHFTSLTATTDSYCAIENDPTDPSNYGQVYCWGSNNQNKLGLGNLGLSMPTRVLIPAKIGLTQKESTPVPYRSLAGGISHVCGLRTDNKSIDCWGSVALGDGIVHEFNYSTPVPTAIKTPSDVQLPILSLVGGGTHECLLDSDNQVWCWGDNQYGEIDATSLQQFFPSPVIANYNQVHTYSAIASGDNFTCGLENHDQNKLVKCWGKGFSSATNPLYQVTSSASDFGNFTNISAGGNSACILSGSNNSGNTNLWCFGDNTYGQLGNGESGGFNYLPQPVISDIGPLYFVSVAHSAINTCGLTDKGLVYCWGDNHFGQTGVLNTAYVLNPEAPINLAGVPGIFSTVATGLSSTCLVSNEINESGNVTHNTYCLGLNSSGQLGNGSTNNESKPFLINTIVINNNNVSRN